MGRCAATKLFSAVCWYGTQSDIGTWLAKTELELQGNPLKHSEFKKYFVKLLSRHLPWYVYMYVVGPWVLRNHRIVTASFVHLQARNLLPQDTN